MEKHQFVVPEDPVLSMHLLEERYHIEDELLDAISRGNSARALSFMEALGNLRFVPRTEDALRNRKNLILTLNTLLRRKAYETGVHPFYIDAVSGNFARMIESIQSVEEINDLISYMVQSYCQLVEQRSMSSYSDPIRQILVTIDASLTGDLSLKRFANELFLNTSYLSTLFKKEVGMTLTDYVNTNRIEYAKKLLRSTLLPVQDVAAACGIPRRPLFHTALPPHHGHDATRVETLKDRGMECGRHGFCKYTVSACSGLPTGGGNPLKQNGSISFYAAFGIGFRVFPRFDNPRKMSDNRQTMGGLFRPVKRCQLQFLIFLHKK